MATRRGISYADPDPSQPDPTPSATGQGDPADQNRERRETDWLQEPDEQKIARLMQEEWDALSKLPEIQREEAKWEVNELRRAGYDGVRLIRDPQGTYRSWIPLDGGTNLELNNEARRLCRVFVGNLMADPPAPQVFPGDTGEDDRDASDVAERALADMQSEQRLNTGSKVRDALDTACTYGSGYIVYAVDQSAGGRVARTMQASPLATHPDHPLIDPATGMPHAPMRPDPSAPPQVGPDGQVAPPPMIPDLDNVPDPIERMVHRNGQQFTEQAEEAAYDWRADLTSEVLSPRHVRLLPHTAENVWEAEGVMVGTFQSWGALKSQFPELATLGEEEVEALIGYRPQRSDQLLPLNRRGRQPLNDHALVWTLLLCCKESPRFPEGFYGLAIGHKRVPYRAPWVSYATGKREPLLLPVAQVKLFRNGRCSQAGDGLMDDLGAISEVMAAQIGHMLQYLDWFNNPTTYIPLQSTIQDEDVLARKPIIRFLPGGEPKMLEPPKYPDASLGVFELMKTGAMEAAHTPLTAQGQEDANVQSGRHAYQIIAQAQVQLSEPKQNVERAYVRCCQIELQFARAFGVDGVSRWTGEDGEFKSQRWEGSDLTGDVRLKPGTMTMLSPAAKAQLTEQWTQVGFLSAEEGRDLLAQGVGAVIGLRDNPFKLEVRRQIAQWEQGPPEGWQPFNPLQAVMQQGQQAGAPPPMIQAAVAQVQAGVAPAPPDPMAEQVWQPRAHHALPGVAQIRVTELAKLMATAKYHGMPRPWQALVEAEFQRMAMAAQPPMPQAPPPEGANGHQHTPGAHQEPRQGPAAAPAHSPSPAAPGAQMPPEDNPALTQARPMGGPAARPGTPSA